MTDQIEASAQRFVAIAREIIAEDGSGILAERFLPKALTAISSVVALLEVVDDLPPELEPGAKRLLTELIKEAMVVVGGPLQ